MAGRIIIPTMSAYIMSKFALRAFNDCLRQEMRIWGVDVILIEPSYVFYPSIKVNIII
jgi:short-subunit dehydrogenase